MKTSDLIQLGALAVVGFLAYQKFKAPSPSSLLTTGGSPLNTNSRGKGPAGGNLPVDFGVDSSGGWDEVQQVSSLTELMGDWS